MPWKKDIFRQCSEEDWKIPELQASGARKAAAERAAINAPMQGTAADPHQNGNDCRSRLAARRKLRKVS